MSSAGTKATPHANALLFFGIAIIPLYLASSGGIQPAHILLIAFSIVTIAAFGFEKHSLAVPMAILLIYVTLIEGVYALISGSPRHLFNPAYFLFNLVFVAALQSHISRSSLRAISASVTLAALFALTTVLYSGVELTSASDTIRSTGTFNNPNQLGYFSVCILAITYVLYREKSVAYVHALGLFAIALALSIASLSKAAIVANLIVIFLVGMPRNRGAAQALWLFVGLFGLPLIAWLFAAGYLNDLLFVQRLSRIGQEADSSFASRGYYAFQQGTGFQTIFGLGRENVLRIVGHEVHSTFATMMNEYGAIGLSIFVVCIYRWMKSVYRLYGLVGLLCVSGPPMIYGLTHNGTRFTAFWLLIGMSLGIARSSQTRGRSQVK